MATSTIRTATVRPASPNDGLEQRGQLGLAVRAGHEAAERDPDLARGDVVVEMSRITQDHQQAGRDAAPGRRRLLHPGATRSDRGELGRHVERVERDHHGDDTDGHDPAHRLGSFAIASSHDATRRMR